MNHAVCSCTLNFFKPGNGILSSFHKQRVIQEEVLSLGKYNTCILHVILHWCLHCARTMPERFHSFGHKVETNVFLCLQNLVSEVMCYANI